jgi:hypothetical protein
MFREEIRKHNQQNMAGRMRKSMKAEVPQILAFYRLLVCSSCDPLSSLAVHKSVACTKAQDDRV